MDISELQDAYITFKYIIYWSLWLAKHCSHQESSKTLNFFYNNLQHTLHITNPVYRHTNITSVCFHPGPRSSIQTTPVLTAGSQHLDIQDALSRKLVVERLSMSWKINSVLPELLFNVLISYF